jgi:hypothetical protein
MPQFNIPTPLAMVFPQVPQTIAEIVLWTVVTALVVYAIREWRRTGSPLALTLLAGGGIALLNEPLDDILGLVHHPRPGQHIVFETMGPIPHWGLPTYIIFFGGIPYVLLLELRKLSFTPRAFWIGIAITFVLDLLIEMPLLHFGLYAYFGYTDVPMSIGGFPLYWLLINTTGPILCAAILFAVPGYFTGWRTPMVLFLPLVTDAACSAAVGLPVYNALHTPGANGWLLWAGAIASCAIGLVILDGLVRWINTHTRSRATQAACHRQPSESWVEGVPNDAVTQQN